MKSDFISSAHVVVDESKSSRDLTMLTHCEVFGFCSQIFFRMMKNNDGHF